MRGCVEMFRVHVDRLAETGTVPDGWDGAEAVIDEETGKKCVKGISGFALAGKVQKAKCAVWVSFTSYPCVFCTSRLRSTCMPYCLKGG